MKEPRWTALTPSEFPWEREALDWLREKLPDADPWHAWSNFEFIDEEGKVSEVDLLVLAPGGLVLVEIKSFPGVLTGDGRTWSWRHEGRDRALDHPLFAANRKAKRLASLLKHQQAMIKSRERLPWIEPAIFLSSTSLNCKLDGQARAKTYLRGRPGMPGDDGIIAAIYASHFLNSDGSPARVDGRQASAIRKALGEAGIRASNRSRRVGDYLLGQVIGEGVNYQEWSAKHTAVDITRRIRIFGAGALASQEERAALARQAKREFSLLEGVEHPGILKPLEFKEAELGSALIFDYDPSAQRLDHYIQREGKQLNLGTRLQIIRDLAKTLAHAHKRSVFHRALTPASVLIRSSEDSRQPIRVQVMNWQTGARGAPDATATQHATTGTLHVSDYVDDPNQMYLAPEALMASASAGPTLDVFSLGAIAYLVLSGEAPGDSTIEVQDTLRRAGSLTLSDAMDGAAKGLQDLVGMSTRAQVAWRIGTATEFLEYLDLAEDELTAPTPEETVDPASAQKDARLAGGLTVIKRLDSTATSDVLLVRRDGNEEELVLKVASSTHENDRTAAEAETLRKLHHQNIVRFVDRRQINGREAILMHRAGEKTLRRRLRDEGRLTPDLLRRFGEELIGTLDYLEQTGVSHRDIKPDNIGIDHIGDRGALHLILFDFSLARTPASNISAGTRPYLDPFLALPDRRQWNSYAERYAAAITLHEMASGQVPQWGDGQSAPEQIDDEVNLAAQAFDPHLRDGLVEFFAKALRRDYRQRFDNAEDMLAAWRRVFERAQAATTTSSDQLEAVAARATPQTTIAELGFSVDAQNVLERMGIYSPRQLLAVDRVRFRYLSSVADKTRKEIRTTAKRLAQLRPDLAPGGLMQPDEEDVARLGDIDQLAAALLPKRPAGDDLPEERAVALYLGIETDPQLGAWPTLGDAARVTELPRTRATESLLKQRTRWLKDPQITAVRDAVMRLIETHGGVMTATECARGLLAERGSIESDEKTRVRLAAAVVRAATEAESGRDGARFQVAGTAAQPLLCVDAQLADYALRLAAEADRIACEDPLLSPVSALAAFEAVALPNALPALSPQRIVRLAVAASSGAALSSRGEIYAAGMSALQALRHSLGALIGARRLTVADVQARVRGRFPAAEALPGRPALDVLLQQAGAQLVWQEVTGFEGPSYASQGAHNGSLGSSTHVQRLPTQVGTGPSEVTEDIAAARAFEDKLRYLLSHGGFLALTVPLRLAPHAARELAHRFKLNVRSMDELLIDAMLATAVSLNVDWNVVLKADAAASGSADWNRLLRLVGRAAGEVCKQLIAENTPVLLTDPGLIARYEQTGLIQTLQAEAGRPGKLPAAVLLVPSNGSGAPNIDGVAVPIVTAAQWAAVPAAWVGNVHRGTSNAV